MNQLYKFPIQIFIILEKLKLRLWLNRNLNINNYYIYLSNKWIIIFFQVLKHEVLLNNNILVEHTIIDNYQKKKKKWLKYFLRFFVSYNLYLYLLKIRFLIFISITKRKKKKIMSIDRFYRNANWLERESSEMYGFLFSKKRDARKLLLDYSKIEAPMLKDFPVEGLYKVFFNFFFNQVSTIKNELVEL